MRACPCAWVCARACGWVGGCVGARVRGSPVTAGRRTGRRRAGLCRHHPTIHHHYTIHHRAAPPPPPPQAATGCHGPATLGQTNRRHVHGFSGPYIQLRRTYGARNCATYIRRSQLYTVGDARPRRPRVTARPTSVKPAAASAAAAAIDVAAAAAAAAARAHPAEHRWPARPAPTTGRAFRRRMAAQRTARSRERRCRSGPPDHKNTGAGRPHPITRKPVLAGRPAGRR